MSETNTQTAAERYQALAAQCAGFDLETRKLMKQKQDEAKQFLKDRAVLRADLLRQKQAASVQMRADEAAVLANPPAVAVAAETPSESAESSEPESQPENLPETDGEPDGGGEKAKGKKAAKKSK